MKDDFWENESESRSGSSTSLEGDASQKGGIVVNESTRNWHRAVTEPRDPVQFLIKTANAEEINNREVSTIYDLRRSQLTVV